MLHVGRPVRVRSLGCTGRIVSTNGAVQVTVRLVCGTELVFAADDVEPIHREPAPALRRRGGRSPFV